MYQNGNFEYETIWQPCQKRNGRNAVLNVKLITLAESKDMTSFAAAYS
jgi:hypothetical protein